MYVEYSKNDFNSEEEIEIIELSEDVENKIQNIAKDLDILSDVKHEEEEDIEEVVISFDNLFKSQPAPPEKPLDYDEIRKNVVYEKIKFSNTIQYINLFDLVEIDDSINFFENPDDDDFLNLSQSIEIFGIVEPLIVKRIETTEKYIVIAGRNRCRVLMSLFNSSKDEKYLSVPCLVLDSSTNYSMIQGIIISTNLSYRRVSRKTLIKSIFLLDEILTMSKKSQSEINVTETIARNAGISRTTVNNYKTLKGLSPKALDLVFKKHMNLYVARMLSKEDHKKQDEIIAILKENINDAAKVKSLLREAKSIYDEKEKKVMPATWERKIEFAKNMTPAYTQITVKMPNTVVDECLNALLVVRKNYALKNMKSYPGDNSNQFFKVKFNENHMNQYINKGYLKQSTLDKVKAIKFNEVVNLG